MRALLVLVSLAGTAAGGTAESVRSVATCAFAESWSATTLLGQKARVLEGRLSGGGAGLRVDLDTRPAGPLKPVTTVFEPHGDGPAVLLVPDEEAVVLVPAAELVDLLEDRKERGPTLHAGGGIQNVTVTVAPAATKAPAAAPGRFGGQPVKRYTAEIRYDLVLMVQSHASTIRCETEATFGLVEGWDELRGAVTGLGRFLSDRAEVDEELARALGEAGIPAGATLLVEADVTSRRTLEAPRQSTTVTRKLRLSSPSRRVVEAQEAAALFRAPEGYAQKERTRLLGGGAELRP